jgi:hypothetical protein
MATFESLPREIRQQIFTIAFEKSTDDDIKLNMMLRDSLLQRYDPEYDDDHPLNTQTLRYEIPALKEGVSLLPYGHNGM